MPLVLAGATSGSTTITPTDAVTVVLTAPATSGTLVVGGTTPTFTTVTATTVATTNLTIGGTALGAGNASAMKNRIINGAMVIDQRNAGAATANTINGYVVDRFQVLQSTTGKLIAQQNAGSVTPPVGFSNYLGITSQSAFSIATGDYYLIRQNIEGFNTSDLGFGTANAKTVTLSFWAYSSLTGTFTGSLQNSAGTRSYPFNYTISSANTWTQINVTVAGDTTGTWVGASNSSSFTLNLSLGIGSYWAGTASTWGGANYFGTSSGTSVVGTSGATFYITGVQLEVGSSATGFEYRQYGTELALCQRYLPAFLATGTQTWNSMVTSTTVTYAAIKLPVTARVAPTGITIPSLSNFTIYAPNLASGTPTAIAFDASGAEQAFIAITTTAGSPTISSGQSNLFRINPSGYILFTGCEL